MLALLVGVVLGLLVAFGPLRVWNAQILHAADAATAVILERSTGLLDHIDWFQGHSQVRDVLAASLALLAPGILAALLMLLASAMAGVRHVLAVILIVFAVVAFFTVEPGQAVAVSVVAAVAVAVALFPALFAARAAMWVVITVLAVDQIMSVWGKTNTAVWQATETFQTASHLNSPLVWQVVASVVVAAPFVFGFVSYLQRFDRAG